MSIPARRSRTFVSLSLLALGEALAQPNPPPPQAPAPNLLAEGGNSQGYDMAPETRLEVVEAAVAAIPSPLPPGPFQPTWDSLKANYRVPAWFNDAKFGIFMHWGLYAVPAHHNEWYEKHMYGTAGISQWHVATFGPHEKFGYKDFIPLFTCEKFDAQAWAALFQKSGARFVIPTAQHHDNFALWDSQVTPFNSKKMGPKRDLIGELEKAVRAQGMKFGVSNHGIENFQFINPPAALLAELKAKQADLFDPKWAAFYNVADRSEAALKRFLVDWYERNVELIEKYQPDMLWFDNGVDIRYLDPLKLRIAAHYYNRAAQWGRDVSLSTKKAAYSPTDKNTGTIGSIIDFEKVGGRSPSGIRTGAWQVDDPIGSTWGYTTGMKISDAGALIGRLIDTVSKNGTYLLNISPKPDGTIPQDQQDVLLAIGRWLEVNGEAIYGTHSWTKFGEGSRGQAGPYHRFTVKGDTLYVILIGQPSSFDVTISSLVHAPLLNNKVTQVSLLGGPSELEFTHDATGLKVKLPSTLPGLYAYTLKISGLKMNPPTATPDGNPLTPTR
ncbi:MAG TPA: alpha-L-fucosidase [Opitutaceae bacterium]|nr:alpha-L-fucosidase [Opitutaceae bacterium]